VIYGNRRLADLTLRQMIGLRRREMGFVFQGFALIPELTAWENVELPLRIAGIDPAESSRRAHRYLERVGLGKRARHYVFELSGGEQQRVAVARGLVSEPGLLFADEPTGELDRATGRRIVALFREAADGGAAVCLTSHDPELAEIVDRVIDLEDGRIVGEVRR
jgi:putative ABC transport system ATP-binding protein